MGTEKMTEVQRNILTRCSTRSFTAEPVSDELLMQLIDAGLAAPWAFHDHARHLCAISGHENVQILARVFSEVLNRPGYNMYRPAAAILACVERGNDNQKLEVGCMLENIYLRAKDLGLGACWINQARDICDDPRVREVLRRFGVPETHVVWGIAIVGYAASTEPERIHREGTFNIYK